MNPKLSITQQRVLSKHVGGGRLQLLYKATIHGFTGAAFHQRCDNHGPTVSVGYNASGYVFGGYTSQPFSQSGQYVADGKAFLFALKGERVIKYNVTNAAYAVKMMNTCGPYFGESLVLVNGNQAVTYSNAGSHYTFNAAEMHGNNLNLTECEVYDVTVDELERPWRTTVWDSVSKRKEMMDSIRHFKPTITSLNQVRVLLIGQVGAGKSSFFNSINSIFRGHVTSQATAGCSKTSLTTKFRTYSVKDGREGRPLPLILCDTMGLEENTGAGLDMDDITNILKGHVPDTYQFNPAAPLQPRSFGYRESPAFKDQIHCVAYVIDASMVSIMSDKVEAKLEAIRRKVNLLGLPQLVLLTKPDECCPLVSEDVRNIYSSSYIRELVQTVNIRIGVPMCCIVPVKNYSMELDLDLNCDILLLSAVNQMLRYIDNYFDDISDSASSPKKRARKHQS